MSHRPQEQRKLKRLRKMIGHRPLPGYIDLIDYLKTHRHANTTGEAIRMLMNEQVRSSGNKLGFVFDNHGDKVLYPYAPSSVRGQIYVSRPRD
jgi:hypothetical protein